MSLPPSATAAAHPIRFFAQNSSFPPSVSAAPKPEISSERSVNVEEKPWEKHRYKV